ncbi:MAG: XRE family transcriptional regulator [Clostridiaceae bacterium]
MLEEKLLIELVKYVKKHSSNIEYNICEPILYCKNNVCNEAQNIEIEDFINHKRKSPFNQVLFGFIDKKGFSDSNVYKKADIDRRLFSKIRSNTNYHPGKNTVIALALALELSKKETDELLSSAGYSLTECDTFDLVIQFCINKKIYNIQNVNEALDYFSLKPLIGAEA